MPGSRSRSPQPMGHRPSTPATGPGTSRSPRTRTTWVPRWSGRCPRSKRRPPLPPPSPRSGLGSARVLPPPTRWSRRARSKTGIAYSRVSTPTTSGRRCTRRSARRRSPTSPLAPATTWLRWSSTTPRQTRRASSSTTSPRTWASPTTRISPASTPVPDRKRSGSWNAPAKGAVRPEHFNVATRVGTYRPHHRGVSESERADRGRYASCGTLQASARSTQPARVTSAMAYSSLPPVR